MKAVQELSLGGGVTANLLGGLAVDDMFTRTASGTSQAFLTDAQGSTSALTDGEGEVQTQYTYESFGGTTTSGLTDSNPFQYTGRENDGQTELYYYRARYYSPITHRFISEDPIGFSGGDPNLFVYARNSPIGFTDPTGLDTIGVCATGRGGLPSVFKKVFGEVSTCLVSTVEWPPRPGVTITGGGGGTSGITVGGGLGVQLTSADDPEDLKGTFYSAGATGGEVGQGSVEGFFGPGHCKQLVGGGTIGPDVGGSATGEVPGEVHTVVTHTRVWTPWGKPKPCDDSSSGSASGDDDSSTGGRKDGE